MPLFLDTRGLTSIAIAVCDRCKMKRAYSDLGPDPNFPGLRVCGNNCKDQYDPYRLPARKTERINLRFPRPDVSVANVQPALQTGGYGQFLISTQGNQDTPENNGNLDVISPSP
jgi:hypothetical protein